MAREPVITAAAIQAALVALLNVARDFGWVSVTNKQMSTLNASLAVVLPLVFAVLVRQRVLPTGSAVEGTEVALTDGTAGEVRRK